MGCKCSMLLVSYLLLFSASTTEIIAENETVSSDRINESAPSDFSTESEVLEFTNNRFHNSHNKDFIIKKDYRLEYGSKGQDNQNIYDNPKVIDDLNSRIIQSVNSEGSNLTSHIHKTKYNQIPTEYYSNAILHNSSRLDKSNQTKSDIEKNNQNENNITQLRKDIQEPNETFKRKTKKYCGIRTDKEELDEDEIPEDDNELGSDWDHIDFRKIVRDIENVSKYLERNNLHDLLSLPKVDLKHCVFGKSTDILVCEYIGIACDYKPFISYNFFLRFLMFFEVLQDEKTSNYTEPEVQRPTNGNNVSSDCEQNQCLVKLSKIKMEKVDGPYKWNNASKTYLGPTFIIYILEVADKIEWEMDFHAQVAVGILQPDSGCIGERRRSSLCTGRASVSLVNFPKIAAYRQLGYANEFWEAFRILTVRALGGRDASLKILLSSSRMVWFDTYFAKLLNGTALCNLTINSFNMSSVTTIYFDMNDLKHLDLSNNYITHFDAENVKQSPNVEHLVLASNQLQTIPEGISSLHRLRYLDLSNNPIGMSYIESSEVLRNLKNLKWLRLSHVHLNILENLHALLGNSSVLLQGLDISYCNLSIIKYSDFFQKQHLLEEINLSGNNLSALDSNLFNHSNHLKNLNLSNSLLKTAPRLQFGVNITFEHLDLSHNQLTSPENVLMSGKTWDLDLSYNLIMGWFGEAIFSISNNCRKTKCTTKQFPTFWVKNLNLSYNKMPTVTSTEMESMSSLNSVDLGGNPFDCSHCNVLEFGSLIRKTKENGTVVIFSLGLKNELFCSEMGSLDRPRFPIRNLTSLPDVCMESEDWVTMGSVLGTVLLLIVIVVGVLSCYKFEVAYLIFLLRQKRKTISAEETDGFEFDAFVCYSRCDRSWVIQEMVPKLEDSAEKYRLCLHERDFILGSFISLNVIRSMQKSRFTALILSNSFIQSQWCRWEMEVANHKVFESGREFLILLELQRLDQNALPRHLKFLMDTRTYLEWPEPNSDATMAWKRLKKNLGKSIHQQQLEKHNQDIISL